MILMAKLWAIVLFIGLLFASSAQAVAQEQAATAERMFEATFESRKKYSDPFNDVDVDVVFTRKDESWRVPAFWRGGNRWTVRFTPPSPGEYIYHLAGC